MQGTAAAYDLARFADPAAILLGDYSEEQARKSAARVNGLVGREICRPCAVDALDPVSLEHFLREADVVLSCVPYWMHPRVAAIAILERTHMVDLGGNTDITMQTLELDEEAKRAGVTVVPDAGLAPGLVNSVGLALIERLDETESVRLYCGVLPQNPQPPFNYKLTFNVEGLVTEYDFQATVLRGGEVVAVDTLDELEEVHLDELGPMEAFTTSGGTSTAPYTLKGRLRDYEYKTLRFPGHCERMRIFKDFGFWNREEVETACGRVRPLDVFHKVFGDSLACFEDKDQCAVRGVAVGTRNGERIRLQLDLFDRQCEETGFTSMERLTGFSISILAIEIARGGVRSGAVRYEEAMTGTRFLEELARRDIEPRLREEKLERPISGASA